MPKLVCALLFLAIMGSMSSGAQAQWQIAPPKPTLNWGDQAPALHITHWIRGEPVSITDGKGEKVYLLEFWATWCLPCIQSMPHLSELQEKYEDRGLVVIGVTNEHPSIVKPFIERIKEDVRYHIASDGEGKTTESYMTASGMAGIPASFIIDRKGKIAWIGHPMLGMDEALEQVVEGKYDLERVLEEKKADEEFLDEHFPEFLAAAQQRDWPKVAELGMRLANTTKPISKSLRVQFLDQLAWALLEDSQDPDIHKKALHMAKTAYEVSEGQNASVADTYAKALFVNKDYVRAIELQKKAIAVADPGMREELQSRLRTYEQAAKPKESSTD